MTGFQGSGSERKFQSSIDQIMEAKPEGAVSSLQERLRELNIGYNATQQPPDKVLEELTVEGVVKHIQELKGQNKQKILVMTGAGISTAAGIPDFRTPNTGLYDNLQKYDLPTPEAIFEIDYFNHNPKPFFHLAKELYPDLFKPTLSHFFIRLLAEEGLLLRNYTQNIDTLERRAGVDPEYLVEAHGNFHCAHCTTCRKEYTQDYVREFIFRGELSMCTEPGCASVPVGDDGGPYRGLVKPDIVFFGESLPARFVKLAIKDTEECELLIIMGTSLKVHPFASLADRVPDTCPRLLINMEKVGEGSPVMTLLGMGGGLDFSDAGYRDVFLQGKCDEGCLQLAKLLGLEEKLMEMFHKEHEILDKEIEKTKLLLQQQDTCGTQEQGTCGSKEQQDTDGTQEQQDTDGTQEQQDTCGSQDSHDNQEQQDSQDNQEQQTGSHDNQEQKDSHDNQEQKDSHDNQEQQGSQEESVCAKAES